MSAPPLAWALACAALLAAPQVAAQPSPEWIRVAVVQGTPQVDLEVQGVFTVRTLLTNQPIREGRRMPPTAVRATDSGLAVGEERWPIDGIRVETNADAGLRVNGNRLRGTLEILRQQDRTLLVINHVALEDYLRGVVSKEAPDYWPAEALQAVAIAARTYALYRRLTKARDRFDVAGTVMSQEYGGRESEKDATDRAVAATDGLILVHQGRVFPTFYHSTCGGTTEHARVMGSFDLPPLRGGIGCTFCSASPFYRWQRRLTTADVAWALRQSAHGAIGTVRDLRVTKRTASNRVEQLLITGSRRSVTLTGYDVRALFGFERIRSALFTVVPVVEGFVLQGRGWGHGVGMCQWGAAELARRGLAAGEILAYYYPGTSVVSLRELAGRPLNVIGGT